MSDIAQAARVNLIVADFANGDAVGKGNITGVGVAVIGRDPASGLTARFTVFADVSIPGKLAPAEFPVELALLNGMGNIVSMPNASGGQLLRIAQVVTVEKMQGPFSSLIKDHVGSRAQVIVDFGNGLPLTAGEIYTWRLTIDGDDSVQWTYPIAVLGNPPQPVIG